MRHLEFIIIIMISSSVIDFFLPFPKVIRDYMIVYY